ncbi:phosphoenolpyruvate--protein phosphotransferase [Alteromonas oceanisediminis]|uniref:phosphoenolpyruvate--protein phosphotransferase n=1 Tax=Alteromonas oceanisediminis TaxID=2836180 RepID=UPI001BD9998C|nr:phosphoenolpyruvate--protein phosphotransferase [Alteromonas oceanisediminis]MBT0585376.1 phosphoenolpyruvate--protein phosphotransferase [Alteromonas oceanisediminis]
MLTTLKRIVQEVNRIPVLDEAIGHLVLRVKQTMQVDACSMYLADYQTQLLTLVATEGLAKSAVNRVLIGFSEGLIGLVGQREEPLNIIDAHNHPRFKYYPEVEEEHFNAFLGAPIIHQRKVLGVITLQQRDKRRFSEDEEAFLVTLAAQIALEIANAEIRGALRTPSKIGQLTSQKNLHGVAGSSGLACGTGYQPNIKIDLSRWQVKRTTDVSAAIADYRAAVDITRREVEGLSSSLEGTIPEDVRSIFQLYHQLLDANSLGREVEAKIKQQDWDAGSALKLVVESYAAQFENMEDPYMQERAIDIIDLSNRILRNIVARASGHKGPQQRRIETDSILVAEEVSAPMLAEFPRKHLVGIISIRGSNNSHTAILARAMGVPAVMGLNNVSPELLDGKPILLDGYSGEVIVNPQRHIEAEFKHLIAEEQELSKKIEQEAVKPSVTEDEHAITLLVNAGLSVELELQQEQGCGVGLYRTEIPFMLRERFPSEREQFELYRQVLHSAAEHEVTLRTLDVGGDKPLPYFPINEENPFLGWRGVRLTLDHPEIFLVQIRAMLRASAGLDNLHIMLPMITSVNEVDDALRLIDQAYHEVNEELQGPGGLLYKPKIGVMLEVPAAIYQIPQLASRVDFFSVGSNDLTQYLLAVDRNNARVANLYSSYHPAVLNALATIATQCNAHNTPVTVCGELAGEPGGAVLLVAMGYRKLSMNAHNLRKINWVIRNISVAEVEQLLPAVLACDLPADVFERVNKYLDNKQLGGLTRAGW